MGRTDVLETNPDYSQINENSIEINISGGCSYQRADGTIETAINAEDAIRRCPVLGKMPLEQANVLLELASIGKAKMEAENLQKAELQLSEQKNESIPKIASKKLTEIKSVPTKDVDHVYTPPRIVIEAPVVELYSNNTSEPFAVNNIEYQDITTREQNEPENSSQTSNIKDANLPEKLAPTINDDKERTLKPISAVVELHSTETDAIIPNSLPATIEETLSPDSYIDELSDNEDVLKFNNQNEIGVKHEPELVLDEETMETYYQLIALEDIIEEESIILVNDDLEVAETSIFQEFIDSQPSHTGLVDFESIKLNAEEQTLEETLLQLVSYLSEVPKEDEGSTLSEVSEYKVIKKFLKDIQEELTRPHASRNEKIETPYLTPEITQKLLSLLRVIGYQNPQEALISFVSRHNLKFLMQAVSYLYQLSNNENQPELIPHATVPTFSVDSDIITVRIGKAIIELIKIRVETLALAEI